MARSCGISFVLHGPSSATDLMAEAVQLTPMLRDSTPVAKGFGRLDHDPATLWVVVEGPAGSALIIYGSPDSNSDLLFNAAVLPWEQRASAPYQRGFVFSGSTSPEVARIVDDARVVPPWFLDVGFRQPDDVYPFVPPSLRREIERAGWEIANNDFVTFPIVDTDGDEVSLTLGRWSGELALVYPFAQFDTDPSADFQELVTGPRTLDWWDPTLVLIEPIRQPALPAIVAQAEELANAVAACYQRRRGSVVRFELPEVDSSPVWSRLENAPDGCGPARLMDFPTVEYLVTERVRDSVPDDESSFEAVDSRARWLREQRGSGFEYSLRGPADERLSPSWITLTSAAFDADTGRLVAAGHLTHEVWGLRPAHDLGAIDGRNGATFPEQGYPGGQFWPSDWLYVGSTRTGALMPLDAAANVISVDLHGPTGTIATLEFLGGSVGAAVVYSDTGQRRVLTTVDNIGGSEPIQFSGDGRWLLVNRHRTSQLIEVATGRWLNLPVESGTWFPTGSTVLSIVNENGTATPQLFDLETERVVRTFPQIVLDVPLMPTFPFVLVKSVSADGREILAVSPAGAAPEYQQQHGVGNHLARITLETGQGRLVHQPFLNDSHTLERDVRTARWSSRLPVTEVRLAPSLSAQLQPPITQHEYLHPGRWADEAEQPLVLTLNKMVDRTKAEQDYVADLVPEVLAALSRLPYSSKAWGDQSEWLIGLQQTVHGMLQSGTLTGQAAASWTLYGSAIAAIQAQRPELIDPLQATWALGAPRPQVPAPIRAASAASVSDPPVSDPVSAGPPVTHAAAHQPFPDGKPSLTPGANTALPAARHYMVEVLTARPAADVLALCVRADGTADGDNGVALWSQPVCADGAVRIEPEINRVTIDVAALPPSVHRVLIVAQADGIPDLATAGAVTARVWADQQASAELSIQATPALPTVQVGELYRHGGGFKIRCLGDGYADGLQRLLEVHGIDVTD